MQAQSLTRSCKEFDVKSEAAQKPSTQTRATVAKKNAARTSLTIEARRIISIIDAQANITDAQKIASGINVRKPEPMPAPPPRTTPPIEVLSAVGNTVTLRLMASDTNYRSKPTGVMVETLFFLAGASASTQDTG